MAWAISLGLLVLVACSSSPEDSNKAVDGTVVLSGGSAGAVGHAAADAGANAGVGGATGAGDAMGGYSNAAAGARASAGTSSSAAVASSAGAAGLSAPNGMAGAASTTVEACGDVGAAFCGAAIDLQVRCDGIAEDVRTTRYTKCMTTAGSFPFSCAFVKGYSDCAQALDCSLDDEYCVFRGLIAAEPAGWDVATLAACLDGTITDDETCKASLGGATAKCLEKYQACKASSDDGIAPFHDDRCFTLSGLTDAGVAAGLECLALDCEGAATCLKAAGTFTY